MIKPYFSTASGSLFHGNCLEVMQEFDIKVDLLLTDPPYPDYYAEEYKYFDGILEPFKHSLCRQIIFWTAKEAFPLDYSAIHIWDKKTGCGSMYERIFERNGGSEYRMFRCYLINSTVAASYTGDEFTGHKSQKPIKLIMELVEKYSKAGDLILDPFAGSGTTAVACELLGRRWILIEQDEDYCKIAAKRIEKASKQFSLFERTE